MFRAFASHGRYGWDELCFLDPELRGNGPSAARNLCFKVLDWLNERDGTTEIIYGSPLIVATYHHHRAISAMPPLPDLPGFGPLEVVS